MIPPILGHAVADASGIIPVEALAWMYQEDSSCKFCYRRELWTSLTPNLEHSERIARSMRVLSYEEAKEGISRYIEEPLQEKGGLTSWDLSFAEILTILAAFRVCGCGPFAGSFSQPRYVTSDHRVAGSSPAGCTLKLNHLRKFGWQHKKVVRH